METLKDIIAANLICFWFIVDVSQQLGRSYFTVAVIASTIQLTLAIWAILRMRKRYTNKI